jgi:pyrophosphatase PpaX
MPKIKTILFDLDGTLIQTTEIILSTFRETFNRFFPHISISDQEMTAFLGQTLFTTFGFYANTEEEVTEIVKYYREESNKKIEKGLQAYPTALETLAYFKKKGLSVGVVTSKMREIAIYHLDLTGLLPYIDGLIGYEDSKEHKPSPEPILNALALFEAKRESTIYIGDHENDMISAKKAGVLTCAVTYSHRVAALLAEQPDFVIDQLDQLKHLI